jgi:hypothetical protein
MREKLFSQKLGMKKVLVDNKLLTLFSELVDIFFSTIAKYIQVKQVD